MAKALCNELGIRPLFINASMDNSIEDIRVKVLQYATTVSLTGDSIKVVILDEAERLSQAAQDSLKGLIELVSANCRFILTTNSKGRIIDPLVSRCTEIDFVFGKDDQVAVSARMLRRCTEILNDRGVTFKLPVVAEVVKKYAPDNRKILNTLQQYAKGNNTIDEGILGKLRSSDATALISAMRSKNYNEVKAWVFDNFEIMLDDFYLKLFKTLEPMLNPQSVPQLVLILNDYQRYHAVVPDKFVHFLSMCTEVMMQVEFKRA